MALVSAIIPTYNRADLVGRAVDSALSQTHGEVEAVVVDDGSTDSTPRLMAERYANDERVRYIRVENGGVSRARNIGLRASRGDYIGFLDSDDYWLPWKIELQVKCLQRVPEAGMIWTNMTAVTEDGAVLQPAYLRHMYGAYSRLQRENVTLFGPPIRLTAQDLDVRGLSVDVDLYSGDIFSAMVLGNVVHTSTALLRRERLQQVGGFREDLRVTGEDYDFHLRTSRAGPVAFVNIDSIGYTIGRSDQLTSPKLSTQLAVNALKTLEPVLREDRDRIHLPPGAIERMLADVHGWAASTMLDSGRSREARAHSWKSLRNDPRISRVYLVGLASLLPPQAFSALRRAYQLAKSAIRG